MIDALAILFAVLMLTALVIVALIRQRKPPRTLIQSIVYSKMMGEIEMKMEQIVYLHHPNYRELIDSLERTVDDWVRQNVK